MTAPSLELPVIDRQSVMGPAGATARSSHPASVDDALVCSQLASGAWAIQNRVAMKDIAEKVWVRFRLGLCGAVMPSF